MNREKFLNASFSPRERSIEVPELQEFFGDGEAVWKVRSLQGVEIARAKEAGLERVAELRRGLVEALSVQGEKADALRDAMGLSTQGTPADLTARIEVLSLGSVSPELGPEGRDVAVRLAETFPTTFYKLTDAIYSLTGQGAEVGKRKPSGKTQKSDT